MINSCFSLINFAINLTTDKFFQSFEREVKDITERFGKADSLVQIEGWLDKTIENTVNKFFNKKIKLSLDSRHLHYLHQMGYTWKQVATMYERHEQAIYRWIRPITKPLQKWGVKLKMEENTINLLRSYIDINNAKTLKEMSDYLFKETGQLFSKPTIFRVLKKNKITYKKGAKQFSERDEEKFRQFIKDNYWMLSLSSLYALDECGFNLGEVPRYGRSPSNCRVVIKQPGKRGVNYTLLLCIRNVEKNGVVRHKLIKGGAKTKDFHDFLSSIDFPADKENHLFLDNARIHHATKSCKKLKLSTIKELAIEKNVQLEHLVSYSPQLNPAELCINEIRQYVEKQRARTEEKLGIAIDEAIRELQKKNLTKYFKKCFTLK